MTTLYVRIKGRVQGPFTIEKLQGLARRGQLGRVHQVSEDGETWRKASDYPDLFMPARPVNSREVERNPQRAQEAAPASAARVDEHASPPASQEHESVWYLEDNGIPKGPLSFGSLKRYLQSGEYSSSTLVWREGMEDWVPADTIEALSASATVRTVQVRESGRKESHLDPGIIDGIADSRGWVVTCSVILTAWCVLLAIGAFVIFVQSVKLSNDEGIIGSLFVAGFAMVIGYLVSLLFRYSSCLVRLRIEQDISSLKKAHKQLGQIWVCCGVILLVFAALFVISFVLQLAGVSPVPDYW
jgi:GYF domain 2